MQLGECKPSPIISKPFIIQSLAKIQTSIVKYNALFREFLLDRKAKHRIEANASLLTHCQM